MKTNKNDIELIKKGGQSEIIAFRATGLNHTAEGPTKEQVSKNYGLFEDYTYETVYENQWREAQYNFGGHFDMNYFTAPYDGLYRFRVTMRVHDSSNYVYMKVSILILHRRHNYDVHYNVKHYIKTW